MRERMERGGFPPVLIVHMGSPEEGERFFAERWLGVALRTNFALNRALTGLVRVRRFLGLRGRARVTTELMMEEYEALRSAPPGGRGAALDAWLDRFGHRGPLESDPSRPRFAELGGELSHASILLREAGTPAVVNCAGVYEALVEGERVRLDGALGLVERAPG